MEFSEVIQSFAVIFALLGTTMLLIYSFWPMPGEDRRQQVIKLGLGELLEQGAHILQYSLIFIARIPTLLLWFLIIYGFILSFYYWYQQADFGLVLNLGLTITTTIVSLAGLTILLAPIIFITQKVLFYQVIELKIFRIAIYAVIVPFLYIFIIQELTPGPLVEGIMLAGLVISFYLIFKGIILCLQAPMAMFKQWWGNRFIPILMVISWLSMLIFNLYTMILLVSNTYPYSFVDGSGPVTEPMRLLYFTITTFTSVGYGDITPRGNYAFFITIVVSLTGFLYSAMFIGGILATFTAHNRRD